MDVKGVAFLARKSMMEAEFGAQVWRDFLAEFARTRPVFGQPVLPISRLPGADFLALNDALLKRFHKNDPKAYWHFGETSAQYALLKGQLKGMYQKGEFRRFLQFTPSIWKSYFTQGELKVLPQGPEVTDLHIVGVPTPHVYFEYAVMGFAKAGLELLEPRTLEITPLKGFSKGDAEVLYRFRVA